MTDLWILTGFAALMAACVALVYAVAVVASGHAARTTAAREAFADTHGLPTAPAVAPPAYSTRPAPIDLNQLRAILAEGVER